MTPRYAELTVTTNFTFLTGASHPDEMVERAAELGHAGVAIADCNTLAGIVRAHTAAKEVGLPLVVGSRVRVGGSDEATERRSDGGCGEGTEARRHEGTEGKRRGDEETERRSGDEPEARARGREQQSSKSAEQQRKKAPHRHIAPDLDSLDILMFPTDRAAYGRLCQLLTLGKRRAPKGECYLTLHDVLEHADGMLGLVVPPRAMDERFVERVRALRDVFDDDRLSIAGRRVYAQDDAQHLHMTANLCDYLGVPMVASNDVHYHVPHRRMLQDVLTCIRHGCTIQRAGLRLAPNAERHLKPVDEMARLFADYPRAIARTAEIVERTRGFNLDQLRYEYPDEVVPLGQTATTHLHRLTWEGAAWRYPGGVPAPVRAQIEHELALITELKYEPYFLTVHDLVQYAVSQGILCQGRGAAANSVVCYCLGVTAVDPTCVNLLFERFISRERDEPPDIDIDFEHERREEVIQYIYRKYGRHRAALTAEVISYRGRSAVRDVGKAMGLSLDLVDRMAKELDWWDKGPGDPKRLRELGIDAESRDIAQVLALSQELMGFPRHLSQHVGGFVITRGALCELVPIENAAMEDRTVIEWDKDDIDALGMLKVDCLGLGMLTCVSRALALLEETKRWRDEETEWGRDRGHESRDGETKRRDDSHTNDSRSACRLTFDNLCLPEAVNGWSEDVSGSCGVAEGDAVGTAGVCSNGLHAHGRAFRADSPDATVRRVDTFKHRGGFRSREPARSGEVPANRSRIAERDEHSTRACDLDGDAEVVARTEPIDRGNRSGASGTDSQPDGNRGPVRDATSSLRLFVSSSLHNNFSAIARSPTDSGTYDMICRADTVGVFQIESRAQMSMLPRLRPRCYYDLVIEVAIVRPGPIQGKMVHPYLRRRNGEEPVVFASPDIERVLGRTLGVPLFQEQAMALAVVAAGFTPGEADQLRRAMAAWKRSGRAILKFEHKLIKGMLARGYDRTFAEQVFQQITGFSGYGFPESHAASFAIIVYVSAWLKRHHPAVFACALINSQPMGFYQPAQIVRDAREHGVEVRGVDVNWSGWDCLLEESDEATERRSDEGGKRRRDEETKRRDEPEAQARENAGSDKGGTKSSGEGSGDRGSGIRKETSEIARSLMADGLSLIPPSSPLTDGQSLAPSSPPSTWGQGGPVLRLGMRLVKGLVREEAERIAEGVRKFGAFGSLEELRLRTGVRASTLVKLADADAFGSMGLSRQRALWEVHALRDAPAPLFEQASDDPGGHSPEPTPEADAALPEIPLQVDVAEDYFSVGLSLKAHPVSFIRDRLTEAGVTPNGDLADERLCPAGRVVTVAGVVLVRQRPGTASGVVFVTIEDETGIANLILKPDIYEKFRRAAKHSRTMACRGTIERQGAVVHVLARSLRSLDAGATPVRNMSRNFH